jgi:hypothetical protein
MSAQQSLNMINMIYTFTYEIYDKYNSYDEVNDYYNKKIVYF